MEPKDTLELLQMNPDLFHSLKYIQESERKPLKKTFLIGMPRSGTTLWARLMENACMSRTVGDKHIEYYTGILQLFNNISRNKGQYIEYQEAERTGIFADEARGYDSREREMRNFSYVLSQLLFANTFRSGFAKSTMLGFENSHLVEFVSMLREVFSEHDLTICFMTREVVDAASSLVNHHRSVLKPEHFELACESYVHQLNQMKEATELGDVWIKYEDFVKDPIPFLRRSAVCSE
jgi:hypothetical protein